MKIRAKNIYGINGYICYLVDEDGLSYGKEAAITNHWMQSFPSSLMNSLQWNKDVELFQMHNMEKIDDQGDLNNDRINVKVMCLNGFYQLSFLRFINNIILYCLYIRLKVLMTLFVTMWLWKLLFENLFLLLFLLTTFFFM